MNTLNLTAQIAAWIALGETLIGSPLMRALLPQIGETLQLTPEQRAAIDANLASYDAMIARADALARGEQPEV